MFNALLIATTLLVWKSKANKGRKLIKKYFIDTLILAILFVNLSAAFNKEGYPLAAEKAH